ncbi:hypothetical protein DSM19430T_33110 [Desulfovibrio psychrotolerans]|uniref:Uncharacterized protein n=1 Tax=Desulfovibrio psychrotolerans TaxID=415242 RepID=A0A7J0BY53_9BACT|nr:hypothetical protein DSM19430T_33110 [Desulfovibrio psychrotolerans]
MSLIAPGSPPQMRADEGGCGPDGFSGNGEVTQRKFRCPILQNRGVQLRNRPARPTFFAHEETADYSPESAGRVRVHADATPRGRKQNSYVRVTFSFWNVQKCTYQFGNIDIL